MFRPHGPVTRGAAPLYAVVNSTLYRYFALVGGPLTVLTLLAGAALKGATLPGSSSSSLDWRA